MSPPDPTELIAWHAWQLDAAKQPKLNARKLWKRVKGPYLARAKRQIEALERYYTLVPKEDT